MKKWILSLVLIAGIISLTACNGDDSEVIAETKAGDISKDKLYDEMKKAVGGQVLLNLIYLEILPEKYEISKDDLNQRYDDFKAQYGENFASALEQSNLTEDDIKNNITLELLIEEVQKAAIKDIEVTEDEVEEYYETNYPKIHARHILVEDEAKAKEVKSKLDAGEKFEDLATEYSTDPGTAQNGGDLQWFGPAEMVKEFTDVAFKLEENEISDPIKTDYGYHIIQTLEKKDKPAIEEVREEIEQEIKQSKFDNDQTIMTNALKEEIKNADVKINDNDLKGLIE